jgi:glycosyltransferase involved in cell wall biosynthesis
MALPASSEKSLPIGSASLAPSAELERVDQSLNELEILTEQLDDPNRTVELPDYPIPAGFLLSVVIPVYNEERTIAAVLNQVRRLPLPLEVVIVDDCSTDGTREILRRFANDRQVRVILKPQNEGKGAALRTGFAGARGDVVVVQDADLEYDPRDLVRLVRPIVEGKADVVYGSRYLDDRHESEAFRRRRRRDGSLVHRAGNALLTWASNCFTGLRLTDMETCYKAFRRDLLQRIELQQDRFGFEPEITAKIARCRVRVWETPVSYSPRSYAEGKKIGFRDGLQTLFCIVQYGVWERGN